MEVDHGVQGAFADEDREKAALLSALQEVPEAVVPGFRELLFDRLDGVGFGGVGAVWGPGGLLRVVR